MFVCVGKGAVAGVVMCVWRRGQRGVRLHTAIWVDKNSVL